jgi:hypothetical protein
MVVHMDTESRSRRVGRSARPHTRAVPPFVQVVSINEPVSQREAAVERSFWPDGIDYASIEIPAVKISEDADARFEVLDLFDDD